jgi:predicted nicotinamide N-methyase
VTVIDEQAAREAEGALADLRARFDVIETVIRLRDRDIRIAHPRDADDLISEADYVADERLPYWADLWPSSRVLAERLLAMEGDGRLLLELGCGAGLASVAAALAGFRVLATDYYADALAFTRANVLANAGVEPDVREVDWRLFPHDLGRFDVVTASDVLYERDYADLVARAFDRTLLGRGLGLVADPGRIAAPAFVTACEERDIRVQIVDKVPYDDGTVRQTIDLYELRRARR